MTGRQIIVVDDGSKDATAEEAAEVARSERLEQCIKVLRLPKNRGKGAAVKEVRRTLRGGPADCGARACCGQGGSIF